MTMSMRSSDPESGAFVMPMANVLHRIGTELNDIAQWMVHMQTVVSPLVSETASSETIHQVQHLDHIAQKLAALADFLAALAPSTPAHWELDPSPATQVVTLSGLTARLLAMDSEPAQASISAGDCELF
jgi:hypothetical protein